VGDEPAGERDEIEAHALGNDAVEDLGHLVTDHLAVASLPLGHQGRGQGVPGEERLEVDNVRVDALLHAQERPDATFRGVRPPGADLQECQVGHPVPERSVEGGDGRSVNRGRSVEITRRQRLPRVDSRQRLRHVLL